MAKRTIQTYMQTVRSTRPSGRAWSTFLKAHGKDIWACDFVPVVTLLFKTIHAFVIAHHESRRVVHVGVTEHPTDAWISQQVRDATPLGEKPRYLICDNDKKYGSVFERVAAAAGIEVIHTPYNAPRANAICERFWRSGQCPTANALLCAQPADPSESRNYSPAGRETFFPRQTSSFRGIGLSYPMAPRSNVGAIAPQPSL